MYKRQVAPPAAAHAAAAKAAGAGSDARVQTYPLDHFDVYDGPWQQQILADQVSFLTAALKTKDEATR